MINTVDFCINPIALNYNQIIAHIKNGNKSSNHKDQKPRKRRRLFKNEPCLCKIFMIYLLMGQILFEQKV